MNYFKLNDICSIKTGKLDANASSENGKYPFFTCSKEPLKIDSYSYDCECVLVAGNGDLNAKYYNGKFDAYQRTYIIEIIDKTKYSTKFIYELIKSNIDNLKEQSIGAVIKYIKISNLANIIIPDISIHEQDKIVSEFEHIYKMINNRTNQKKELNYLLNSLFQDFFGNPVLNEKKWEVKKLNELGFLKNGMNYNKTSNGYNIKIFGVGDFKNNKIIDAFDNLETISLNDSPALEYLIKDNDILFVRSNGNKELVGRSIIFSNVKNELTYSGFCIRYRNNSNEINPKFLIELFQNDVFFKYLKKDSRGANINNINQQILSNLNIIIPPINLQNDFVSVVEQIENQKKIIDLEINDLMKLLKSIEFKYFSQ